MLKEQLNPAPPEEFFLRIREVLSMLSADQRQLAESLIQASEETVADLSAIKMDIEARMTILEAGAENTAKPEIIYLNKIRQMVNVMIYTSLHQVAEAVLTIQIHQRGNLQQLLTTFEKLISEIGSTPASS